MAMLICGFGGLVEGCSRSASQPCAEYDRAESFFDRLTQEHLDPNFGHPSFRDAADRFAAVPDHCPRKERAEYLAKQIHAGQASREQELRRQEEQQAEASKEKQKKQAKRQRHRSRRQYLRERYRYGTYCTFNPEGSSGLATGLCYPRTSGGWWRCQRHIESLGYEGDCSCTSAVEVYQRYCHE